MVFPTQNITTLKILHYICTKNFEGHARNLFGGEVKMRYIHLFSLIFHFQRHPRFQSFRQSEASFEDRLDGAPLLPR